MTKAIISISLWNKLLTRIAITIDWIDEKTYKSLIYCNLDIIFASNTIDKSINEKLSVIFFK